MLEQCLERKQSYEKAIAKNAQRVNILANDNLDVARIESPTLKLSKSKFDLNQEAENVIKDISDRRDWENKTSVE